MKRFLLFIFIISSCSVMRAQDANISSFFGANLEFYAQQFDGQKYLIMKFTPTDNFISLLKTSIKLQFGNGAVCKWDGYCITSWENSTYHASKIGNTLLSNESKETINAFRFDLTDKDIELLKEGVTKVSIYTVPKVFRKEYTTDKLGMKLYNAFKKAENEF